MKLLIQQLANYNVWANELLLKTLLTLPPDLHEKKVESSFENILSTLIHMIDSESIWWQRMKLSEKIVSPGQNLKGGLKEASMVLSTLDRQWLDWIMNSQEHVFTHEFIYQNSKKEQFKQPVFQVILHLFNHNTYHRGQLVNMMRQLGVDKIPATDFIVFTRKK